MPRGTKDGFKTIAYKQDLPTSQSSDDQLDRADSINEVSQEQKIDYSQFPSKDDSLRMECYYRGLLNQAIYEEATAKLLPVENVREFLTLIGSRMRTLLTQLPDRLSPRVSHESDEETIHLLISREIEQITKSLIEETSEDKLNDVLSNAARNPVIKSRKISQSHKG